MVLPFLISFVDGKFKKTWLRDKWGKQYSLTVLNNQWPLHITAWKGYTNQTRISVIGNYNAHIKNDRFVGNVYSKHIYQSI